MHPMLNKAIQAARLASKPILQAFDRPESYEVHQKGPNDWVSDIDQLAEQIILDHLKEAYPQHAFLAEETGKQDKESPYCWIIDPIDGTSNYIHQLPHFAISIALQQEGKTILGLIYDPIRQEMFTAEKGKGAYLNQTRMRVSGAKQLRHALIGTGFPFRSREDFDAYFDIFKRLFAQVKGIRRAGSAALDLAYIAAGRLDGFWEGKLNAWDIAAGALMIQEAGGLITDFKVGGDYLKSGNVVAGSPRIHKALHAEIAQSVASDSDL